ncbi:uncharacterized protein [Patagioenas fasciata]|uniref:uncharacterized protein isoform X4 n=1 Tax=Patagioenas fasciata TaxID=372321 RepID=UPI003A9962D8
MLPVQPWSEPFSQRDTGPAAGFLLSMEDHSCPCAGPQFSSSSVSLSVPPPVWHRRSHRPQTQRRLQSGLQFQKQLKKRVDWTLRTTCRLLREHEWQKSSSKGNRGSLYCSLKLQLKSDWIKLKEIPLRGQPCWKLMSTSQRQTLIHEQKPHVLHNAAPNVARQSKLATAQEEVITAPQLTILGQETSLYTSLNPPSQGKPPRPPLVSNEKQEFVTLGSSVLVKATQHLAVLFPTDVLFCW